MPTTLKYQTKLMTSRRVVREWVDSDAVKQHRRTPGLIDRYIQSTDDSQTILVSSIRETDVRGNWEARVVFQILAEGGVERLT
jgi:hypothetical protein